MEVEPHSAADVMEVVSAESMASNSSAAVEVSGREQKQFEDAVAMEYLLLRLSLEQSRLKYVRYKDIVRKSLDCIISKVCYIADDAPYITKYDAVSVLEGLLFDNKVVSNVKIVEAYHDVCSHLQKLHARLNYLESLCPQNMSELRNTLFQRILLDYLLRLGCPRTAELFAKTFNIKDFVEIEDFQELFFVASALWGKNLTPALDWCSKSFPEFYIIKSDLEFELRAQEFIEIVRAGDKIRALAYAQLYLAPWQFRHLNALKALLGTLTVKADTNIPRYKENFDAKKWRQLVARFPQVFYKLNGISVKPLLHYFMQYGLYAVKTPDCYKGRCRVDDPLYQESMKKLAMPVPFGVHEYSNLVCYITGELIDGDNYPLALPNGYVYGNNALKEMARRNGGRITCPRTGLVCNYKDLKRVYVL